MVCFSMGFGKSDSYCKEGDPMTYNHDRAKVLCPEAAAEVERLRGEVQRLDEDSAYFERMLVIAEKQLKELRAQHGGL